MQFLALFFLSWLFVIVTVSRSQLDLSSSPVDLFHDDSQLFVLEPQLQEANSLGQLSGSDSNFFSDDYELLSPAEPDPSSVLADIDPNQIAESDPSVFAAGDIACDSSDASYPQLFGKLRRRRDTCRAPPTGETGEAGGSSHQPGDGDEPTDLGFTMFATSRRTLSVFPRIFELCPFEKFLGSNIPVCKEFKAEDVLSVAAVPWFNLRNVIPRTFA